jgi:hypothetical protein
MNGILLVVKIYCICDDLINKFLLKTLNGKGVLRLKYELPIRILLRELDIKDGAEYNEDGDEEYEDVNSEHGTLDYEARTEDWRGTSVVTELEETDLFFCCVGAIF